MKLHIHPENPEGRKVKQAASIMTDGGVIIYPTDTVYALACDLEQPKAVDRMCRLRRLDPSKAMLTLVCADLSMVSAYAHQIDNSLFRMLKRNLPGPFTFVIKANNKVPRLFRNKKKTIGFRIPDHTIVQALIQELGRPFVTTSLKGEDDTLEYFTDPEEIYETYGKQVDLVIDGGPGGHQPSTLVFAFEDEPQVIRQGLGELQW